MQHALAHTADGAARGWVEYRRAGRLTGGGWPRTCEDVATGVDLIADHADALHLDLDRLAIVGHSAGGQLALWAAGARRRA